MPIENLSNIRRLPRLGKIRTGEKRTGQKGPYPHATDYFVCPDEVKAVYGEKPTELKVMFPADDLDLVAPQWYKCYSYSQGLLCRGDGKTCRRKVDTDTGDFANKDTKHWELVDTLCTPDDCPMLPQKQCRRVMNLLFILPDVPGLGVYQLDTSSFYSIVNINSQLAPDGFLRPFTRGRISFIPLILSIGPQEVTPPGVGRKTVYTLNVRADVKLTDLIQISRKGPVQVLLPTLAEEEPPEDLYPGEVIGQDAQGEEPPPRTQAEDSARAPAVAGQPAEEDRVIRAQPPQNCTCPKPVPPVEVRGIPHGSCFHTTCGGYLCTPPIDCYPGCPHTPLESAQSGGTVAKAAIPEKAAMPAAPGEPPVLTTSGPAEKTPDDVAEEDVPDLIALFRICHNFWKIQPEAVCKELGYRNQRDLQEARANPWHSFLAIKTLHEEKRQEG